MLSTFIIGTLGGIGAGIGAALGVAYGGYKTARAIGTSIKDNKRLDNKWTTAGASLGFTAALVFTPPSIDIEIETEPQHYTPPTEYSASIKNTFNDTATPSNDNALQQVKTYPAPVKMTYNI